ncbi:unnamed protein product, partial [Gulo gulo]
MNRVPSFEFQGSERQRSHMRIFMKFTLGMNQVCFPNKESEHRVLWPWYESTDFGWLQL